MVFCVNLPRPRRRAAERLAAYVAGGGNVVWICGDNVNPDAYNQMNQQAGGQLSAGAAGGRPHRRPASRTATVGT